MKHDFRRDSSGKVDYFALEHEIHNGPQCVRCDDARCEHCEPEWIDEECPGVPWQDLAASISEDPEYHEV